MVKTIPQSAKVVIIGGGVAGYVAAIKAGQEGMMVGFATGNKALWKQSDTSNRSHVLRSVAH